MIFENLLLTVQLLDKEIPRFARNDTAIFVLGEEMAVRKRL
jgi:hypothetical protein